MGNKIICALRWLAVLPSAIIGALVGTAFANFAYKAAERYVGESALGGGTPPYLKNQKRVIS